jgi:hypothetical protein
MGDLLARRGSMGEVEFLTASQAIYGRYRPIIKYFSAMLLDIALRQRLNVLFETTGVAGTTHAVPCHMYYFIWCMHVPMLIGSNITLTVQTIVHARRLGYEVSVVYPYVSTEELLNRVNKRNSKVTPFDLVIIALIHLPSLLTRTYLASSHTFIHCLCCCVNRLVVPFHRHW